MACRAPAAAGLLALWLAGGAAAQEPSPVPTGLIDAPPEGERGRFELSTRSPPLFDGADAAPRTARLELIWLPPRLPSLGLALGLTSREGPGLRLRGDGGARTVDLGLHWRYPLDSHSRLDVTAWRRVTPADAATLAHERQAAYGARFEMQIKALPGRRLVADRGLLGLQLESGARITVKRRHGGPMIYYRTRF